MDALPTLKRDLTSGAPTIAAYEPLLKANAEAIKSTPFETFTYGPHPRHQLDVYQSPTASADKGSPVFLFLYGGGLINGDKKVAFCDGLLYANVAHFFAQTYNFTVVIPDYRLVKKHDARYPSGGEDVALAIEWIAGNLTNSGPRDLYILGQSAGGIHVSTYLFAPQFLERRKKITDAQARLKLRSVAQLSVPFGFQAQVPERIPITDAYYGSVEQAAKDEPTGLIRQAQPHPRGPELADVRFLVGTNEFETDEILACTERFREAWGTDDLQMLSLQGHNHLSPSLSLGTGIEREEKWGHQVGDWMLKRVG